MERRIARFNAKITFQKNTPYEDQYKNQQSNHAKGDKLPFSYSFSGRLFTWALCIEISVVHLEKRSFHRNNMGALKASVKNDLS